jgi:uncharacterized membrane protein
MDFINRVIYALTNLHPLHPMFVHFPIGLTGAAFFFILLAWLRKSRLLEQVAFANISLAVVATVAAAATGIFDNERHYAGDAPNAMVKMTLATLLLILTAALAIVLLAQPGGVRGWRLEEGVVHPRLRAELCPGVRAGLPGWHHPLRILIPFCRTMETIARPSTNCGFLSWRRHRVWELAFPEVRRSLS